MQDPRMTASPALVNVRRLAFGVAAAAIVGTAALHAIDTYSDSLPPLLSEPNSNGSNGPRFCQQNGAGHDRFPSSNAVAATAIEIQRIVAFRRSGVELFVQGENRCYDPSVGRAIPGWYGAPEKPGFFGKPYDVRNVSYHNAGVTPPPAP